MYGQSLNTNELSSKQTTNAKKTGRKVDYERLKQLSKPKFKNDPVKTMLAIKLNTKAKEALQKTSSTTLCYPIELKTSKNDRQTLSAKQLASVDRLCKKNVKRTNDVLEVNGNPVNKAMKLEFRPTTSKKSTRNINENLFDETILVQGDEKRYSVGVVSLRNINVNLLDKTILVQDDEKRCLVDVVSTETETSKMDRNLNENHKHCCEWTEQMIEQYNGDILCSDDNNKRNDMVETFLNSDRRIILTRKRLVPDDENVLEGTVVVKDDLLTVEHSKPTSDVDMVISSTYKSLNAASKRIRPFQMTIPVWEVIWFLVIFTVLMLNIKHAILLREPTKDDSFLKKFSTCDAVDRRIPPMWSMRDEERRSPKRDGSDEATSRLKVIGKMTLRINAAQCENILQYCRVHGKGSTTKNDPITSEFESNTATQNTKVIYQKHIVTEPNATRNMDDNVKATTRNDSTLALLMVPKRRQNTCMRRGSEMKTHDSDNYDHGHVIWNSTMQAELDGKTNIILSDRKRSWADVKISSRTETYMAGENLDEMCPLFIVWIKRTLKERRKSNRTIVTYRSNDIAFGSTEAYAIYLQDNLDGLKLEMRYRNEGALRQKVAGPLFAACFHGQYLFSRYGCYRPERSEFYFGEEIKSRTSTCSEEELRTSIDRKVKTSGPNNVKVKAPTVWCICFCTVIYRPAPKCLNYYHGKRDTRLTN